MEFKYSFFNDYSEGAHPEVLKAVEKYNTGQESGYGEDSVSRTAAQIIKEKTGNPDTKVYFVSGGTQANLVVLSSILKPYESVIAAKSSHINTHEAGAIEGTGHKIDSVESSDGKVSLEQIQKVVDGAMHIHMAKPRAVFVSQSTEVGTIYNRDELSGISSLCKRNNLYLYLDGARLGSALASSSADLTLRDIASLTDIFYIGGTKNGAAIGEAIVISNPTLQENFEYYLKRHGALLAKGRFIASEFVALFDTNLYLDLAKHANETAILLAEGIKVLGFEFLTESPTNQIFPILPNRIIEKLQKSYGFYTWEKVNADKSAIRLVTSWATPQEKVGEFLKDLKSVI